MGYGVWGIGGAPHRSGYGYGRLAVVPEAPGMGYDQMLASRTARGMGYTTSLYPLQGAKKTKFDCLILHLKRARTAQIMAAKIRYRRTLTCVPPPICRPCPPRS